MARVLVIWCPDWPVAAAGVPATEPVAVLDAGRILACSVAARAEGVRPGQRRRQAQECCPELELIAHDPDRDARAFEPVLVAVESLTPRIEVLRPGECAFPARGAARYHGGEATLTAKVLATVDQVLGVLGRCQVGIADGRFAASLAARHAPHPDPTARDLASRASPAGPATRGPAADPASRVPTVDPASRGPTADPASRDTAADGLAAGRHWIVPSGETLGFLASFPVEVLERSELTDLLIRLGLRTLGDLAALPRVAMAARFGPEGIRAHRLATGLDEHPRASRRPPPELGVAAELDPPVTRVDVAAFAAKSLADELVDRLERLGLACTRLRIEVETEHGEMLARVWRHEPPARSSRRGAAAADPRAVQVASIAERVRWQLDGWLTGSAASRPTGAITHLALMPDEAVAARGRQLGFWGEETEASRRAARALARVQGLLGPEAVRLVSLRGGRTPTDRVVSVAEGELPSTPDDSSKSSRPKAREGPGTRAPGARGGTRTRGGSDVQESPGTHGASGSRSAPQSHDSPNSHMPLDSHDFPNFRGPVAPNGSSPGPPDPVGSASSRVIEASFGSETGPEHPRAATRPPKPGHLAASAMPAAPDSSAAPAAPGGPDLPAAPVPASPAEPAAGDAPATLPLPGLPIAPTAPDPLPTPAPPPRPDSPTPLPVTVSPAAPAKPAAPDLVPAPDRLPKVERAGGTAPKRSGASRGSKAAPWPGRIPEPSPAIVHHEPVLAKVQDARGAPVTVNGRGVLSADPSWLRMSGVLARIVAWAGPWPVDERWWDPNAHQRLARLQVTSQEDVAYLLKLADGQWWIEATYD
jgi:protein ImuB